MRFRVVGGHQVASAEGQPISFLIDETIAIDAGSLAGGLTMEEQDTLEHVLLTHYHYDHLRDLPFVGLAALDSDRQIEIHCSQLVRETVEQHLLNNVIWPDFFKALGPHAPAFVHRRVEPGRAFALSQYEVLPVDNRHHPVPVTGFQFTTPGGRRLLYTGDTGPGIRDTWPLVDPDVLVTEVTWSNAHDQLVTIAGHLTPELLELELVAYREAKGKLPKVLVCHINQVHQDEVAEEVEQMARRLQADIQLAHEGTSIDL